MLRQLNARRFFLLLLVTTCLFLSTTAVPSIAAQGLTDVVTLSVNAGYDGYFRSNNWLPLRIEIENNGDDLTGRIVVRPETSGSGITNTFSTPVNIASGSSQSLFLYITARSNATRVRVELLSDEGDVVGSEDANLRSIAGRDRLYVVVSQAAAGSVIDLAEVKSGGYEAYQANWSIANLPDHAPALNAVNALVFNDVDTGTLSNDQRITLREWVTNGGHLIVTGGAAWQPTAAGLRDLLPLIPDNSLTAEAADITPLLQFGGDYATETTDDFIVATGALIDGARTLTATAADVPLMARRELGGGTVDYVTIDPNTAPLRQWQDRSGLWVSLLTSTNAHPSWTHGISNWQRATDGIEILPGLDLLPAVIGLIAFLGAYIALVGPLNYLLLARLNRREWAWITIPILILIFSVLARVVGFNLRGNQATLSRLTVIQSWPDSETAQVDQLVGLLVPRRDEYTLGTDDERMLRPIPSDQANASVLGGGASRVDIRQTDTFEAVDFQVDASFIAGFNTSGTMPRPDIGGRATLSYSTDSRTGFLQGAISNNSDQTLYHPVILARGMAWELGVDLAPGDVRPFDSIALSGLDLPVPSSIEYGGDQDFSFSSIGFGSSLSSYANLSSQTAQEILGVDNYIEPNSFVIGLESSDQSQEERRQQAFLDSFVIDQFGSTGRGNRIYLAAWGTNAPLTEVIAGASWSPVDSTLYLIELEVEVNRSANTSTLITRDQFTWTARQRNAADVYSGPSQLAVTGESELIFRFTPLPDAILKDVTQLVLIVERSNSSSIVNETELWNWREQQWEPVTVEQSGRMIIPNARRFLGPQNAVEIRIVRSPTGGNYYYDLLAIEQRGRF